RAEFGDDEGHAVLHQAADVVDVAGEPIELGADDRRLDLARKFDRGVELRPGIIRTTLGLGERFEELERLGCAEPRECSLLGLEAETAAALLLCRHADVSNRWLHRYPLVTPHRVVTGYNNRRHWSSGWSQAYCCKQIGATGARAPCDKKGPGGDRGPIPNEVGEAVI